MFPCDNYLWCFGSHCTGPQPPHDRHETYFLIPSFSPLPMGSSPSPCYWHLVVINGDMVPLLLASSGHHWRAIQTCSLEDLPQLVIASGSGHQNRYDLQARSTHPIGMFSCCRKSCPKTNPESMNHERRPKSSQAGSSMQHTQILLCNSVATFVMASFSLWWCHRIIASCMLISKLLIQIWWDSIYKEREEEWFHRLV